jgi:uncharacterized membrane protein YidH (DUF202 family)
MMTTWEQVLLGIVALALAFFFWPGVKASLERSRQAEQRDWLAVLLPIGAVVLFVILLVVMARS